MCLSSAQFELCKMLYMHSGVMSICENEISPDIFFIDSLQQENLSQPFLLPVSPQSL